MSFFVELKRRNVVRVALLYAVISWVVLQIADILFGLLDVPAWGLRLVLGLLILGLPFALVFSWVYELTPEGLKRESEVDRSRSVLPQTGRKIDRLIIACLGIVIVALLGDRFLSGQRNEDTSAPDTELAEAAVPPDPAATPENSIAVLPFVNISDDAQNEYFSDGLTEELLNLLAQVEGLKVAARTSSFSFKGANADIATVAEQLMVSHILEGSVRKAGTTVRITAQLIKASDGYHLWSATYDRKLADIFAIQDEIAAAVVEALTMTILGPASKTLARVLPASSDVYVLYLKGRHVYNQGKDRGDVQLIRQAMALYESALAQEPDYALAHAGLADAWGRLAIEGEVSEAEGYERSRRAVFEALAIDDRLPEAWFALADIQFEYDWDLPEAQRAYQRALEIRPRDAEGLRSYGYFLGAIGRFEEAIAIYRETIDLDPLSVRGYAGLARSLRYAGRHGEANAVLGQAQQLSPDLPVDTWWRESLISQGRYEEAAVLLPETLTDEFSLADAAIVFHALGQTEKAQAALQQLTNLDGVWPSTLAAVFAQTGDFDRSLEYLSQGVSEHELLLPIVMGMSYFRPLRDDLRFWSLLEDAGIQLPRSQ